MDYHIYILSCNMIEDYYITSSNHIEILFTLLAKLIIIEIRLSGI